MTVKNALLWGEGYLKASGAQVGAQADAAFLLGFILKKNRPALLLSKDDDLTAAEQKAFTAGIERLADGEPLQYVTGIQNFYGLDFKVDERVLIPRYDTETLCEQALLCIDRGATHVLDLCTGSGVLAVTLLTLALVAAAWRWRGLRLFTLLCLALVAATALLGGVSILIIPVHPAVAAADQGLGMVFFACVVGLTVWSHTAREPVGPRVTARPQK
jgi:hypothetical protein